MLKPSVAWYVSNSTKVWTLYLILFWNKTQHLPVYLGCLECICWNSLYCISTPVHWCTFWGYWNFQLEFVMQMHITTHTRPTVPTCNLSYDCNLWKYTWSFDYFWHSLLCTCRSFEAKGYWTFSHCFFACVYVCSQNAFLNITKYMSSTGITMNFDILWKFVLDFIVTDIFTSESSFKGTPLDWALANILED